MSIIDKSNFDEVYQYVITHVARESGNVFSDKNKSMVESRICKRLLTLNISSMSEYLTYIKANQESELKHLVGLLTTHHTFFFREYVHFEFIEKNLDTIIAQAKAKGRKRINIWSSACSKGHEVYSLACFLDHRLKQMKSDMDFQVFGSDIDEESIAYAKKGVYPYQEIKQVPASFLEGYWQRGKGAKADFVKIKSEIQEKCRFFPGNLLAEERDLAGQCDVIFCRNALIYFENNNIKKIVQFLLKALTDDGFLFTGVSEPIGDICVTVEKVGPCVYQRTGVQKSLPAADVEPEKEEKIRMVLVDDSPPVLKILEKMFSLNDRFEVVGKCKNGQEAVEFFKNNQADAMTLDLHMPVLDGVGYLKDHYNENHPPVIVVSSVNKDNESLGKKAVEYGAIDYVEKPTIQNLHKSAEEITNKIIVAVKERKAKKSQPTQEVSESSVAAEVKKETSIPLNRKKSLYHRDDVGVNKTIIKIDLYVFAHESDKNELKRFLHELYDLGYMPKAIITNRNTNWVEQSLTEFDFKYSRAKKRQDDEILMTNIDDFIIKHLSNLKFHNQIMCMFPNSKIQEVLNKKYTLNNYILATESDDHDLGNYHVMPSPSWAFHVEEKYQEYLLPRNKYLPLDSLPKYGHFVYSNEVLVGVYNKESEKLLGIVVTKSFNQKIDGILPSGQDYQLRLVGSLMLTKGLMAWIPSSYDVSKVVHRDQIFRFGATPTKIVVGKRSVCFKSKGQLNIKVEAKVEDKRKKILVVDDSLVFGKILRNIIDKSQFVCSEIVTDPTTLEQEILKHRPDVITLDVNMPVMSGVEVFDKVIKKHKIPTVVISSSLAESKDVMTLLSLGAVDYLHKPSQAEIQSGNFPLIEKIELALSANMSLLSKSGQLQSRSWNSCKNVKNTLILIGGSTGGTKAVNEVLKTFPDQFPPTVVAIHIPEFFSNSFAEHLNADLPFKVKEASDGETLEDNTVYIAKGGSNLEVHQRSTSLYLKITAPTARHTFIPNVDELFYFGSRLKKYNLVAMLLTGMGKDGAVGMGRIQAAGGYTVAQDQKTCVIYGMPKAAVEAGHVNAELPLYEMSRHVFQHINKLEQDQDSDVKKVG